MAHDAVAEATVIGVPHKRWQERPVALLVMDETAGITEGELQRELVELIRDQYPKWWAPDDVVFSDEVPKTATGKFDKKVLREEYGEPELIEGKAPDTRD